MKAAPTGNGKISFHPHRPEWIDTLLRLNNAAEPAVNTLTRTALEKLFAASPWARVALAEQDPVGFLLGLVEGAAYNSVNYRFFGARYPRFAYIDRVVINPAYARRGLGRNLYQAFADWARKANKPVLACEVNLKPRNDTSLRFHESLGFKPVGTRETDGKLVRMLIKPLATDLGVLRSK